MCYRPAARRRLAPTYAHMVFVTKYRRRVLGHAMLTDCEDTLRDVCTVLGAELVESNGEPTTYTCSSDTRPPSPSATWCVG